MYKDSEYYYPGLIAGKGDSHLPDGGYSFVSAMQSGNMKLFAAVIGAEGVERPGQSILIESYTETARLYDWAQQSFSWRNATMEHRVVATMPVDYGLGRDTVDLSPAETVRLLLPNALTADDIKYSITLSGRGESHTITAPVARGDVLGALTVRIPGRPEIKVPLIAEQSIRMDRKAFFREELRRAVTNKWVILGFIVIVVIVAAYAYIVVMYRRTQYENEMRRRESLRMLYEERKIGQDTTRLPHPAELQPRRETGGNGAPKPEPDTPDDKPPARTPKAPGSAAKQDAPEKAPRDAIKVPGDKPKTAAAEYAPPVKATKAEKSVPKPAAPDEPPRVLKMPAANAPKPAAPDETPRDVLKMPSNEPKPAAPEDALSDVLKITPSGAPGGGRSSERPAKGGRCTKRRARQGGAAHPGRHHQTRRPARGTARRHRRAHRNGLGGVLTNAVNAIRIESARAINGTGAFAFVYVCLEREISARLRTPSCRRT